MKNIFLFLLSHILFFSMRCYSEDSHEFDFYAQKNQMTGKYHFQNDQQVYLQSSQNIIGFDHASDFLNGYARINLENKYYFINKKGETLPGIANQEGFDFAWPFHENGYTRVLIGEKFHLINSIGDFIQGDENRNGFDDAEIRLDGIIEVRFDGKYCYFEKNGTLKDKFYVIHKNEIFQFTDIEGNILMGQENQLGFDSLIYFPNCNEENNKISTFKSNIIEKYLNFFNIYPLALVVMDKVEMYIDISGKKINVINNIEDIYQYQNQIIAGTLSVPAIYFATKLIQYTRHLKTRNDFLSRSNLIPAAEIAHDFMCGICHSDDLQTDVYESKNCLPHKHQYHLDCLLAWYKLFPQNTYCFFCRKNFFDTPTSPIVQRN